MEAWAEGKGNSKGLDDESKSHASTWTNARSLTL